MTRIGRTNVIGASGSTIGDGYFGDGSDGDLVIESDNTVTLPVTLDEGQIIKQYRHVTIAYGAILKPANRCNGTIILVNGNFTLDGTIDVSKCAPLLNSMEASAAQERHIALCGALTGGNGGNGGRGQCGYGSHDTLRMGAGGTGGAGFIFGGGMGGGGGGADAQWQYSASAGSGGNGDPRAPVGTTIPYTASTNSATRHYGAGGWAGDYTGGVSQSGGKGPGGGGASHEASTNGSAPGGGDAIGGGSIWIFVKGKVRIGSTGKIIADGGNGGKGGQTPRISSSSEGYANGGGGGGAGGGIICLVHTGDYINGGSILARGGTGGLGGQTWSAAPNGGDGSVGATNVYNINDLLSIT